MCARFGAHCRLNLPLRKENRSHSDESLPAW
jgi:hypothetical protein